MIPLYTIIVFVASLLIFWSELFTAKMILPYYGGSPAVWNTCLVFYQVVLLAGYCYANLLTQLVSRAKQVAIHAALFLLCSLSLPITPRYALGEHMYDFPISSLLFFLTLSLGPVFFILSSTSVLLQRWFSFTHHPKSYDPYFLYAAGNLGAFILLALYPALIERTLTNSMQSRVWTWIYLLLGLLILAAGIMMTREFQKDSELPVSTDVPDDGNSPEPLPGLRWMALSFVPSALLLCVTFYISTNLASIPLFWIIPLALYLLTFATAFSQRPPLPSSASASLLPVPLVLLTIWEASGAELAGAKWLALTFHLAVFFLVSYSLHSQLSESRPKAKHLARFYFFVALGGALGGVFSAIAAPLLFNELIEYPLMLFAAVLLLPLAKKSSLTLRELRGDLLIPLLLVSIPVAILFAGIAPADWKPVHWTMLLFGIPALLSLGLLRRPHRFALTLALVLLAGRFGRSDEFAVRYQERTFFGLHTVMENPRLGLNVLTHGTTVHGAQFIDGPDSTTALTYYFPTGPAGEIMAASTHKMTSEARGGRRIALIGLGVGSLAAYGLPADDFTALEIDPTIINIASNPALFTMISSSQSTVRFVVGDARLKLAAMADQRFDILFVDAFSSDAVPVHLLSLEAVELYMDRIGAEGIVAFHISNKYLNLLPVISRIAEELDLAILSKNDQSVTEEDRKRGKYASHWAVIGKDHRALEGIKAFPGWAKPEPSDDFPLWTDDYSNLFMLLL